MHLAAPSAPDTATVPPPTSVLSMQALSQGSASHSPRTAKISFIIQ